MVADPFRYMQSLDKAGTPYWLTDIRLSNGDRYDFAEVLGFEPGVIMVEINSVSMYILTAHIVSFRIETR